MELTESQLNQFEKSGYCIIRDFLNKKEISAIREEILHLQKNASFKKAGIGKDAEYQIDQAQRGDFISWIDPEFPLPAATVYIENINQLLVQLNRTFYLGIRNYECHYAIYPAGTFYKKHVDRHQKNSPRVVSMVFYLNEDWVTDDGGQLRIYQSDVVIEEVLPEAGTLVIFLSEIEHEVMPTRRTRMSLTGWMRNQ